MAPSFANTTMNADTDTTSLWSTSVDSNIPIYGWERQREIYSDGLMFSPPGAHSLPQEYIPPPPQGPHPTDLEYGQHYQCPNTPVDWWRITKHLGSIQTHPQFAITGMPDLALREGDVLPSMPLTETELPSPEMVIHIPRVLSNMANEACIRSTFHQKGLGLVDEVEFVGPHVVSHANGSHHEFYEAYVYMNSWFHTAANRYLQEKILEKGFKVTMIYDNGLDVTQNSYWILNMAYKPKSYRERQLQKENAWLKTLLVDRDTQHVDELSAMRAEHDDEIEKLQNTIHNCIVANYETNGEMTIPDSNDEDHRNVLENDPLHDDNMVDIRSQDDLPVSESEYMASEGLIRTMSS